MMGKVMNKQAVPVGQQQSEGLRADRSKNLAEAQGVGAPGKKTRPGQEIGPDFAAQLAQAAVVPAQAVVTELGRPVLQGGLAAQGAVPAQAEGAMQGALNAPGAWGDSEALVQKSAVAGTQMGATQATGQPKAALNLNKAASLNTGSAVSGLSLPWSNQDQELMTSAPTSAPGHESVDVSADSRIAPRRVPVGEVSPQGTRGEADLALALKSIGWTGEAPEVFSNSPNSMSSAGMPIQASALPNQQAMMMEASAAIGNAPVEAHLALPGGVFQGGKLTRLLGGSAQAGLSGGEFLSALGAAKGQMVMSKLENESQFQGGQGEGGESSLGGKPSLRMIQGGFKGGKGGFEDELASQPLSALGVQAGPAPVLSAMAGATGMAAEVTGHVTKGANDEDRLSSEALNGITNGLRGMTAQGAGGEMRIRLRPDNLGELHVRVVTDGRNVGLQIQATDEKAKRIIEESLGHLKESMAAQNLSLGAVDLTVGRMHGSSMGDGAFQGNQHSSGQNGLAGDWLSQQGGQGARQEGRGGEWGNEGGVAGFGGRTARPLSAARASDFSGSRGAGVSSGRLDVTA